ncbi:hypothetical protein ADK57_34240 [Streptomyces sp. MMG1533]|uniref:hypothetical protein n=1 Tax=Streptomyces sp. MMG1533 TaxID=1415546 RepID=UPI0006AE4FF0|nr:hypothetical protein [Streptomyces sp. MMG1533]KOU59256.1 hypothetical protein ADK57_34240 [Streptomyces sp. MMG1533]
MPGYDLGGPVPWIAAAYPAGPTPDEAVTEYGVFAEAGARALPTEPDRAVAVIHEAGLACRGWPDPAGADPTRPGLTPATPGHTPQEQTPAAARGHRPTSSRRMRCSRPPAPGGDRLGDTLGGRPRQASEADHVKLLSDGRTLYVCAAPNCAPPAEPTATFRGRAATDRT